MTEELPDPLVPLEVDLRDFQFTPIFRARLFGSSFHARSNDAEWRAGVTLWLKSWDQVPAGTLPDDDIDLCRLAEFGRDMKGWHKVRTGALHGWRKCSDGRLHHAVVAQGVLEAWEKRSTAKRKGIAGASKRWGTAKKNGSPSNAIAIAGAMPGDSKGQGRDRDIFTPPEKPAAKKPVSLGVPDLLALGVDEQVARDWLTVRKAKHAPLTGTALEELKREASKAGIPVARAVLICARRSWQGFNSTWNWQDETAGSRLTSAEFGG